MVERWITLAAAAACLYLAALQVLVGAPYDYAGLFSDGVSYLFMADIIGGTHLPTHAIALTHWQQSQFPPGYPAILALLGADSGHPAHAVAIQAGIAVVALVLLGLYLQRVTARTSSAVCLLLPCALMAWNFPGALELTSEPAFLAILLLALLLERSSVPEPRKLWLLALVAGLLCVVRSAGLPLVVALGIWAWARGFGPVRTLLACLLGVLPSLGWMAFKQTVQHRAGYGDALPLLLDQLRHDPAGFIATQAQAWLMGLSPSVEATLSSTIAGGMMLLLALPGIWAGVRRAQLDATFLLIYLALVAIWPYPAEMSRLLAVVLPLILLHAQQTLLRWTQMQPALQTQPLLPTLALIGLLALSTPGWRDTLARAHRVTAAPELNAYKRTVGWYLSADPDAYAETAHRTLLLARAASKIVADTDCIYTTIPSLVALQSGRATLVTPQQILDDAGLPAARRCQYFLVSNLGTLQGGYGPLHPLGADAGLLQPLLSSERRDASGVHIEAALLRWRDLPESSPR